MSNLVFGQLVDSSAKRDAVHMAVAPVTAGSCLAPGCHVKITSIGLAVPAMREECIGVIDPFLRQYVLMGERCWLFLYPGTISALRHDWSHPALDAAIPLTRAVRSAVHPAPPAAIVPPEPAPVPVPPISEAERYLQDFAAKRHMGYAALLELADGVVKACERCGYDGWRNVSCSFPGDTPDEFWDAYEKVRGVSVPLDHRGPLFNCDGGITDEFSR